MYQSLKFIFGLKLYMFQTVPLAIIRSFFHYTHSYVICHTAGSGWNSFRPDPAHKLSANLCAIYHCCVYSGKLLMMDRGTV